MSLGAMIGCCGKSNTYSMYSENKFSLYSEIVRITFFM